LKPKVINLDASKGERIIAVVPERASGPGWANTPTWVYVTDIYGLLRCECIQPEERTPELNALFDVGAAVSVALFRAIPAYISIAINGEYSE
jgi:hypothetical protein